MSALGVVRVILAGVFFGWGLLALFRVPLGFLWKPAVAATEWGHVLSVFPLALLAWSLLAPGDSRDRAWIAAGLSALATLFLLSSLLRAVSFAKEAEARFKGTFDRVKPGELPGAPARPAPIALGDLLSVSTPKVTPTRHLYREIEGHKLHLDLYQRADAPRPQPLVIVIHGGSWNSGDSTQLAWLNDYLAARGLAVAAINYRLVPGSIFPTQREDVLAALTWLKGNASRLDIDASRIALLGRSAGGHLALLAAFTAHDPAIRGVVALYAPSDLNWSWEHPTNPLVLDSSKTIGEFLGGTPAEVKAQFDAASAFDFVGPGSPPTLLLHGTRDELVFAEQSRRFAKRLAEVDVSHALLELPWATHGCDANPAGPGGQLTTWAVERFLATVFEGPSASAAKR